MIVTTTNNIEGKVVKEYLGVTFGEVITGVNFVKDFMAGIRDLVGGRSKTYEDELINARREALEELKRRAASMCANAVIGIDVDYEVLGASSGMLMVTVSGTAVIVE